MRHGMFAATPMGDTAVNWDRTGMRNNLKSVLAAAVFAVLLSACAGASLKDSAGQNPAFDPRAFFAGRLQAHGMFQKPSGRNVNRLVADMDASWKGDTLTLDEHFTWSDGKRTRRVWTMVVDGPRSIKGWASDVADTARGGWEGNAFHWEYPLLLEVDGSTWKVWMDDWMWLVDRRTVLNRTRMSKWGFHLGDATLSIRQSGGDSLLADDLLPGK